MLSSGLVSITLRQLSPAEVVKLVWQAGLDGIEWGGDVHVPPGDLGRAREVRQLTEGEGIQVAAYGSYYRVSHAETGPFEAVAETAVELGAPLIRVWAGKIGTDVADADYVDAVVADSLRIAQIAQEAGLVVAYEFHGNTLTDTNEGARRLLEAVGHPHIRSYWQPRKCGTLEDDLAGIDTVADWLTHLHVFTWHPQTAARLPLAAGADQWDQYLARIAQIPGHRFAMLEFVQDDDPANFLNDAATLKEWLRSSSGDDFQPVTYR